MVWNPIRTDALFDLGPTRLQRFTRKKVSVTNMFPNTLLGHQEKCQRQTSKTVPNFEDLRYLANANVN